ncbi:MAG TPA: DUF2849 domain-containing protein [Methylocella sp.]|nr:DUF2849 domain-containing protein [Methylocella sp.]
MFYVISANRLADGIVVYVGRDGSWSERLNDAKLYRGKEEAQAGLLLGQNDAKRNLVVEPCVVEVTEEEGGLRAVTLRESIRARGPTIDFLPPAGAFALEVVSPAGGAGATTTGFRSLRPEELRERELENAAGLPEAP